MASSKFAVVINNSRDRCSLDQVESALDTLNAGDFITSVVSPVQPSATCDRYSGKGGPLLNDVQKLSAILKGMARGDDELVIYVTGKGALDENVPKVCLGDTCDFEHFANYLDVIKYGRRTIIMEQGYGRRWRDVFAGSPRARFFAVSAQDEPVCDSFGAGFWAKDIPDRDGDGMISWEERYAGGMARHYSAKLEGARRIEKNYARVRSMIDIALGQTEAGLKQEATAVIEESVSNAVMIDDFFVRAEAFESIARAVAGAEFPKDTTLGLFKKLRDGSEKFKNDKEAYVLALSSVGRALARAGFKDSAAHTFEVAIAAATSLKGAESEMAAGLVRLASSIAQSPVEVSEAARLLDKIAWIGRKMGDHALCADVLSAAAFALARKNQKKHAMEYYEEALSNAGRISNEKLATFTRKETAKSLAMAGFRERAREVIGPVILKDGQIADPKERAARQSSDAFWLADIGFLDEAVETFGSAKNSAGKIEDPIENFDTVGEIARAMSVSGFKIEAKKTYGALIDRANADNDARSKSRNLQRLASSIRFARLGGVLTGELFGKIVTVSAGISDEEQRLQALLFFASSISSLDTGRFKTQELLASITAHLDNFKDRDLLRRFAVKKGRI